MQIWKQITKETTIFSCGLNISPFKNILKKKKNICPYSLHIPSFGMVYVHKSSDEMKIGEKGEDILGNGNNNISGKGKKR